MLYNWTHPFNIQVLCNRLLLFISNTSIDIHLLSHQRNSIKKEKSLAPPSGGANGRTSCCGTNENINPNMNLIKLSLCPQHANVHKMTVNRMKNLDRQRCLDSAIQQNDDGWKCICFFSAFQYNKLPIHQDTLLQSNQRRAPKRNLFPRSKQTVLSGRLPFKTVDITQTNCTFELCERDGWVFHLERKSGRCVCVEWV